MKLRDIIEKLELESLGAQIPYTREINDVYICDLLSWVMGRAAEGSAWITIQGHVNIIAVGILAEVGCIIIAENAEVSEQTIEKAISEEVPLLRSPKTAYEIAVSLNKLISG